MVVEKDIIILQNDAENIINLKKKEAIKILSTVQNLYALQIAKEKIYGEDSNLNSIFLETRFVSAKQGEAITKLLEKTKKEIDDKVAELQLGKLPKPKKITKEQLAESLKILHQVCFYEEENEFIPEYIKNSVKIINSWFNIKLKVLEKNGDAIINPKGLKNE